ncbi:MAG: nuclear transport factor 2 family protein [Solirubrobacterales bacterium]
MASRACEAAWRRPKPDLGTLNEVAHPDHIMFTIQSLVEGGGYRGAEGFRRWLASWAEMFGEDWDSRVEDAVEVSPDRVLITGRIRFTGQGGGVPIDQQFWVAMTLRDGKLIRSEVHTERDRALAALVADPGDDFSAR